MVKSFPFSDIRVTVRTSTVAGCSYCIKLSFENWILDIFPWMVNFQAFHLVVQFNLKVSHWWYGITNHYEYIVMRMYGISFWCSESHKIKLFHYWICCWAFMYVHKIRWLNARSHLCKYFSIFQCTGDKRISLSTSSGLQCLKNVFKKSLFYVKSENHKGIFIILLVCWLLGSPC